MERKEFFVYIEFFSVNCGCAKSVRMMVLSKTWNINIMVSQILLCALLRGEPEGHGTTFPTEHLTSLAYVVYDS